MKVKGNPKVVVTEETKKILDGIGKKGDTYDMIIMRILAKIGNDIDEIKKALNGQKWEEIEKPVFKKNK